MKLSGLGKSDAKCLGRSALHHGFLHVHKYKIQHTMFSGKNTNPIYRELVLLPKSIGVILYDPQKNAVVMIEQFRMGAFLNNDDPWLLEIVAGFVENNETIVEAVKREVVEEANYKPEQVVHIADVLLSPGYSTEKMSLHCALINARNVSEVLGVAAENEDIRTHVFPVDKLYSMLEAGDINNAPAIIAIQWLKINQHKLSRYEDK
jgi:ADP-ribose pyrophosphatase